MHAIRVLVNHARAQRARHMLPWKELRCRHAIVTDVARQGRPLPRRRARALRGQRRWKAGPAVARPRGGAPSCRSIRASRTRPSAITDCAGSRSRCASASRRWSSRPANRSKWTRSEVAEPLQRGVVADVPLLTGVHSSDLELAPDLQREMKPTHVAVLSDNAPSLGTGVGTGRVGVADDPVVLRTESVAVGPAWPSRSPPAFRSPSHAPRPAAQGHDAVRSTCVFRIRSSCAVHSRPEPPVSVDQPHSIWAHRGEGTPWPERQGIVRPDPTSAPPRSQCIIADQKRRVRCGSSASATRPAQRLSAAWWWTREDRGEHLAFQSKKPSAWPASR